MYIKLFSTHRRTTLHLIHTGHTPQQDIKPCIECWCYGEQRKVAAGNIFCCDTCPAQPGLESAPPNVLHLQYSLRYTTVDPATDTVQPVMSRMIDIPGQDGYISEYDVFDMGPGQNNTIELEMALDDRCPQKESFTIVGCLGHLHKGELQKVVTAGASCYVQTAMNSPAWCPNTAGRSDASQVRACQACCNAKGRPCLVTVYSGVCIGADCLYGHI